MSARYIPFCCGGDDDIVRFALDDACVITATHLLSHLYFTIMVMGGTVMREFHNSSMVLNVHASC